MQQESSSPTHVSAPSEEENTTITNQNGTFFCRDCGISCSGEKSFRQHLNGARHRRSDALKQNDYSCQICCIDLNSKLQLTNHLLGIRHKRKSVNEGDSSNSAENILLSYGTNLFNLSNKNDCTSTRRFSSFSPNKSCERDPISSSPSKNISSYSIVSSFQIPDFLSVIPSFLIDPLASIETSSSKTLDVYSPCFYASDIPGVEIKATISLVFNETIQSLNRFESQLVKKLPSNPQTSRSIVKRKSMALKRQSPLSVKTVNQFGKFSLHNFITSSRSGRLSLASESLTNTNFCSHSICITLRSLLHYKNGLKRALLRTKYTTLVSL